MHFHLRLEQQKRNLGLDQRSNGFVKSDSFEQHTEEELSQFRPTDGVSGVGTCVFNSMLFACETYETCTKTATIGLRC